MLVTTFLPFPVPHPEPPEFVSGTYQVCFVPPVLMLNVPYLVARTTPSPSAPLWCISG